MSASYPEGSVFTVRSVFADPNRRHEVQPGRSDLPPNDPSFDLAVIQFKDEGQYLDSRQIDAAEDCIREARRSDANGAVVVLFIHGWHHGTHWARTPSVPASQADGDEHFHAFRLVLESLALRETERYSPAGAGGRRVVGIYVGWNGDPESSWVSGVPVLTHSTFWNRYPVAQAIGSASPFREAVRRVVAATKEAKPVPAEQPESPLVMIGHSMGALMLQSAFLALLEDARNPLVHRRAGAAGPVELVQSGNRISLPDLVLSLNSAADSAIAKRTLQVLERQGIAKTAAAGAIRYSPPLLVSVTSTEDTDTKNMWRIAKGFSARTDGHDDALFTHGFVLEKEEVTCAPRDFLDLGQNWHCLRTPEPAAAATPVIPIDLPAREREGVADTAVPHHRFRIEPLGDMSEPRLMWVFQVPPMLIKDHNDIFNSRARSLILGLVQVSGAVASVAEDWERSFEP